ncbi:MAG: endolytic transglycosylase MltG [Alphaproteobacteria bacterium]|nr:endolytic transglycosylase MltG [Alphaproteobacteria bacterium]
MRRYVALYFVIAFFLTSIIGGSVFTTYSQFIAEGPLLEKKEVYIPKGKSLKRIAALLYKEGVISSPSVFILGVRAAGNADKIKAGEYSFPKGASSKMVMLILASGQTYIRKFKVPEGLSSYQIVQLMNNAKGLTGTVDRLPKNGSLLPDTYHYSYGDTKADMIVRMKNAMDRTLAEVWAKRAEGLPFKTPKEAVILASVVEKETALKKERPLIASVFVNRLNKGMKLQSDPTVIYALTDGRYDMKRALTYKDLRHESLYNTYYVKGLPRGPISNPGRAALEAVLNPADTKNLYFVANGKGGHTFSETYEAHKKNVKVWRSINKKVSQKAKSSVNALKPKENSEKSLKIDKEKSNTDKK